MGRVLVIGWDPTKFTEYDPEPILTALEIGEARFDELGIDHETCLVAPDEHAARNIEDAVRREDWAVVVIGGGIRKQEASLLLFEQVVNMVRQYAPNAAIAFNTNPTDTADAAQRWL